MVREMIVSAAGTDGIEALLTHTNRMQKAVGSVREVWWVGGLAVGSSDWERRRPRDGGGGGGARRSAVVRAGRGVITTVYTYVYICVLYG